MTEIFPKLAVATTFSALSAIAAGLAISLRKNDSSKVRSTD